MKKLLLALVFCAFSTYANAAACFWVGGTGTWSTTNILSWASATGGTGGTCAATGGVPKQAADTATFDGSSGGGTVTPDTSINNITLTSVTMDAFTGTLDFSASNNNITMGTFSCNGAAVHTLNLGNGTWTITTTNFTAWNMSTATNLTFNANGSTILFQSTPVGGLTFDLGGKTFNNITLNLSGTHQVIFFSIGSGATSTIATLNITSARNVLFSANGTFVLTNGLSYSGSSSVPVLLQMAAPTTIVPAIISSANNVTLNWAAVGGVTFTGGGSFTATNSFDLGNNTGISISSPSGGGGGGHIIGG